MITVLDNAALYTFVLFGKSLIFNNNNAYLYYGLGHAVMTNCPKKKKVRIKERNCDLTNAYVHHGLTDGLCSMSCHPRTQTDKAYT